jgi:hypothetical protein
MKIKEYQRRRLMKTLSFDCYDNHDHEEEIIDKFNK